MSWKTLLDAVGHFETKKTVDDITDKIVEELAPSQVSIQIGLQKCVVLLYTITHSICMHCLYGGFYR